MTKARHWHTRYIGLDGAEDGMTRTGLSCRGLVRLVYGEELGVALPSYLGAPGAEELAEIDVALGRAPANRWPWVEVAEAEAQEFDLVTFELNGIESHVGVLPWPGAFLHVTAGITSRIDRADAEHWRPLIGRFLRHRSRAGLTETAGMPALHGAPVVLTSLAADARIEITLPERGTIADAVRIALPSLLPEQYRHLRVTFGGGEVPPAMWERVRPKRWDTVLIRVTPDAVSDLFRSALLLAVTVAAIAVGQLYLGPLLFGAEGLALTGTAYNAAVGVTSAALAFSGSLLVNALVPPRGPEAEAPKNFAINGFRNAITLDGPSPQLIGEMRFAPPYLTPPRFESKGDERWCIAAFLCGDGPIDLSDADPWVGLTPLSEFDPADYEIELREGYPDDAPLSLVPNQVIDDPLSIDLTFAAGRQVSASVSDAARLGVELFFPAGLFEQDGEERINATVRFKIEQRLFGADEWTVVEESLPVTAKKLGPFWRSHEWDADPRAGYEVGFTRLTEDHTDGTITSNSQWVGLRSIRPEYPANFRKPKAMIAVSIRASGRLNGVLDTFSVFGRRLAPDYDAATGTWPVRASRNAATAARLLFQGPQNRSGEPDANLGLAEFADWHGYCVAKNLHCDGYITAEMTRDDGLADVFHAGRALPYRRGNVWVPIVDRPRTQFYDHVSPRNSTGFSEKETPVAFPDAYSVTFKNRLNKYAEERRIVPLPNFAGETPIVIEELSLPFKTDPDEVYIEARRRGHEAILRRRRRTLNQDAAHLAIGRGDAGYLAHHVIDRRHVGGRVRAVGAHTVTLDERVTMLAGGNYRVRFETATGSLLRSVMTIAGTTAVLVLAGTGELPAVGDHAMFYGLAAPACEVLVQTIERADNHGGRLVLIDHAPEIDERTDADALNVPAWDARVGDIVVVARTLNAPSIRAIDSTTDEADATTIVVGVKAGAGAAPASYEVDHRISGGGGYTTETIFAAEGSAFLAGYEAGDAIDIRVRSLRPPNDPSPYSAVSTYEVHLGPLASSTFVRASEPFVLASSF